MKENGKYAHYPGRYLLALIKILSAYPQLLDLD